MYAFLLLYFVEIKLINQETFSTVHLLKTPVFYTYILLLPFPVTKIRKSGWVGTFVLTILFAHLVQIPSEYRLPWPFGFCGLKLACYNCCHAPPYLAYSSAFYIRVCSRTIETSALMHAVCHLLEQHNPFLQMIHLYSHMRGVYMLARYCYSADTSVV